MDYFDKLANRLKKEWKDLVSKTKAYINRLLFPVYLFPLKLLTYSAYYLLKFLVRLIISLIKIFFETLIFPFRSLKNLIQSLFVIALLVYVAASLFVIVDYLTTQYGNPTKFLCSFETRHNLKNSVVRIVGGVSEGTGFFISPNQIMTNFHVIADEPSPKIIFRSGTIGTIKSMVGDQNKDIAVLTTTDSYPSMVLKLSESFGPSDYEPLMATGYALGTELAGDATIVDGRAVAFRTSREMPVAYIHTDISLLPGMSGGPLTDRCGEVMGINTFSIGGQSLFISAISAQQSLPTLTDQNITKISVDPSLSPADAVEAFYTYLKARRMEDGFNLLSSEYLKKTDFVEWTGRFTDIIDVNVIMTQNSEDSDTLALVKFSTSNWVMGEVEIHFYEGTWDTVLEDGVYKMNKSQIKEVDNPGWEWFYE